LTVNSRQCRCAKRLGVRQRSCRLAALVDKMRYVVILEKGASSFGAYVPDVPGCAVVGDTREEVLQLIREAVDLHVSAMRERGDALPEPASSSEYVDVSV
jgi:predicted RNase H-like HicB family nuclease